MIDRLMLEVANGSAPNMSQWNESFDDDIVYAGGASYAGAMAGLLLSAFFVLFH